MNLVKEKYFKNRRLIIEIIIFFIFLLFALEYFGIPDKYDYYILWFIWLGLIFNFFLYIRFIIKDYKDLMRE